MDLLARGIDYDGASTAMKARWIAWWLERERREAKRGG